MTMPRLTHLNGPPGIGKSTIAQLYVDQRFGVLNLDIDRIRSLIGGWREDFAESGTLARPLALAMVATHLRAGRDVIMPQYLGRLEEIAKFEAAARQCGAAFVEVVLMDSRESSVGRFARRSEAADQLWHRQVMEVVESTGGLPVLGDMHDRLVGVLRSRPAAIVVPIREDEIRQTYDALLDALDASPSEKPARR